MAYDGNNGNIVNDPQNQGNNNNNQFEQAIAWLNLGARVPVMDAKTGKQAIDDKGNPVFKVLSCGGMPLTKKGLKRVQASAKTQQSDPEYWAYATESNAAQVQLEELAANLPAGETHTCQILFEVQIRKPGANSGPPVADTTPVAF